MQLLQRRDMLLLLPSQLLRLVAHELLQCLHLLQAHAALLCGCRCRVRTRDHDSLHPSLVSVGRTLRRGRLLLLRLRLLLQLLLPLLELLHQLWDLLAHAPGSLPRRLLLAAPLDLVLLAAAQLADAQHALCPFDTGRLRSARR
jgi:hypothetical protein